MVRALRVMAILAVAVTVLAAILLSRAGAGSSDIRAPGYADALKALQCAPGEEVSVLTVEWPEGASFDTPEAALDGVLESGESSLLVADFTKSDVEVEASGETIIAKEMTLDEGGKPAVVSWVLPVDGGGWISRGLYECFKPLASDLEGVE